MARSKEVSFGYIKSEGIDGACEAEVRRQLEQRDLELIWTKDVFMSYLNLREHQPILFDIRGDLNDIWKIQGAARLIGTTVRTMGVLGIEAIDGLMDVKMSIRDQFALPCEFDREKQMSYPNYMHAADYREQVEQDVKILVPEKLPIVQQYNGVNRLTKRVW